ncbi:MAG: hypothetical protein ACR2MF_02680 [Chthoniobacterales bacterium]
MSDFYFALPRFIAKLAGKHAARSEHNALEAHGIGAVIFFISYLFGLQFVTLRTAVWQIAIVLIVLLFATWVFWLIVLYINALILKLLRALGFFRTMPDAYFQSVLIGTLTTLFAWELNRRGSWLSIIGIIWIAAVIANLAAALVLALTDAESRARD